MAKYANGETAKAEKIKERRLKVEGDAVIMGVTVAMLSGLNLEERIRKRREIAIEVEGMHKVSDYW